MKPMNKINTQFDIPEMMDVYANHLNYEIIDFKNGDDRCFIYFSGNGLYVPNNSETFQREIIENNRFEWKRNIPRFAKKVIFLRDVTKSWYFEGINTNINTIEKLACFLEEQTRGLNVICVGNSAGGYAATLFGCLLNASHIFNFSGQYSLLHILQTEHDRALNPTLVKYENTEEYRKYFSIVDYIKTSQTRVFYFFPGKYNDDIAQSKLVENIKTVYEFKFNGKSHGSTCFEINFLDLFSQSREELYQLHLHYKNSVISPLLFSVKTSGLARTFNYLVMSKMKSIAKHTYDTLRK
jgi:hypothetical protein